MSSSRSKANTPTMATRATGAIRKKMAAECQPVSDNGGERFSDMWPFIGKKTELLEGGIRVPFIITWPARLSGGTTSQQVVASMDIAPTIWAAAGIHPDPSFAPDGMDIVPLIDAPVDRTLFWRYKAYDQKAVREGDWKYLSMNGFEHLFNLALDQQERADRQEAEPEVFNRLKQKYASWNATMLPQIAESYSDMNGGDVLADRYAVPSKNKD